MSEIALRTPNFKIKPSLGISVTKSEVKSVKAGNGNTADDDHKLVLAAADGDMQAFRLLVEKYQQRVIAVAYGIIGNSEDAEDIVQDSFVKAYKNLSGFRGQSSFYTWLYRIVYNMSIDYTRKRFRKVESLVGDNSILEHKVESSRAVAGSNTAKINNPLEEVENTELSLKIKEAIENLTEDHRAIIVLREIDGLSYEEISQVLKCSKGTVMSRLFHARKKLQEQLREYVSG